MRTLCFLTIIAVSIFCGAILLRADDTVLFTANVAPDALLMLDLSGSMSYNPGGDYNYQASPIDNPEMECDDEKTWPTYDTTHPYRCKTGLHICGDSDACAGPYYEAIDPDPYTTGPGKALPRCDTTAHPSNCSKLAIAKDAIFKLLDANGGGALTTADEALLNVRFGYMRFYSCNQEDSSIRYTGPEDGENCNTLRRGFDFNYRKLYEDYIRNEKNYKWAALAKQLEEGKKYLDDHKAGTVPAGVVPKADTPDPAAECRAKFLVLITDGWDTVACGNHVISGLPDGVDAEDITHSWSYKRRRATLKQVKAAADAGYQVFAIGFGADMPLWDRNTLNWVALKGRTDNLGADNSGNAKAITDNIFSDDPCVEYAGCTPSQKFCENAPNDPGYANLSGYAYMAADSAALGRSLKEIFKYVQEKAFSFTAPTVPSVRLTDGQRVYISSFTPNATPFWTGDMKAYVLNPDGTLPVDPETKIPTAAPVWEAQKKLEGTHPDDRVIYTVKGGSRVHFTAANLTDADFGISANTACGADCQQLIQHVRGWDAWDLDGDTHTSEHRVFKLGDIFHSQAVIVGAPSISFVDSGYNGIGGFYETNKNRTKILLAGANDGMLHAFDAETGAERWAFVPPDLLTNLKTMKTQWDYYKTSGTSGTHLYYVDTSPRVADVWFYSSAADTTKTVNEWKTVLIAGLRKGGKTYFALDITDTENPTFLWQFPASGDTTTLNKMGQSWSEPNIARIKIDVGGNVVERWVAFMGGGYWAETKDPQGKYLFVVDIKTGEIIKEFSTLSVTPQAAPIAAPPLAVDTTSDGYADRVYVGDIEGRMYVAYISDKDPGKWTMRNLLLTPGSESGKHPIYYPPAVAFDESGTPWVYFGSGDREHPMEATTERFYAVKDNKLGPYPRELKDLVDATGNPSTYTPVPADQYGWTIRMDTSQKEKVLSKPVVFNQLVYFTTYSPKESDTSPCTVGGTAKLYVAEYLSGGGALAVDDLADLAESTTDRSIVIGSGVPSSPVVTMNADGQATIIIGTTENQIYSQGILSPNRNRQILYWREVFD